MGNNQGLAVGLAIGIPSAIIIVIVLVIWWRNQRKQRKEDLMENDIDLDLEDDQSFKQFQEELHRPYNDPNKSSTTQGETEQSAEKPYHSLSSNGSTSTANILDNGKSHQKTPSSYDFYESVIPILPNSQSQSCSTNINNEILPPAQITDSHHPSNTDSASSNVSITGSNREKSLDNLAKQLTAPTFFEKLPSRAATVVLKQRSHPFTSNNSSTDLINNTLVNETAINDNYVYEANNIEVKAYSSQPATPSKLSKSSTKGLNEILGGKMDSNLNDNSLSTTASPFDDKLDESEPNVIFK